MCYVIFTKHVPIIQAFSDREAYAARWNARIKID